tara:strand:- start:754 stop:5898 length:5145 start_codon:yes stop_codon:yes gene_type:complete
MALLQTKYMYAGTGFYSNVGYYGTYSLGDMSNSSGGSTNATLTGVVTNGYIEYMYHNGSRQYVAIYTTSGGQPANSGWDTVTINGTTFSRSSATSSTSGSNGRYWYWSASTNPATTNQWNTVTFNTTASDTTPDAFSFTDVSNRTRSTVQTSNTITVAGIDANTYVQISGGSYSKNGGSYTTSTGLAALGDTFSLRHTSSGSYSTSVNTTLTLGTVTDTFTSTTEALPPDTTPDQFTFTDITGATRGTYRYGYARILGINTTALAQISSASGGANAGFALSSSTTQPNTSGFTSGNKNVSNGQYVHVRVLSSSSFSTAVGVTINVGGSVNDTFAVTTEADFIPNNFSFTDVTNVALSATQTSSLITVAGIGTSVAVSVSGGSYSKNGAGYVTGNGTAVDGDTFRVRHTSSGAFSTAVSTSLTIGGVSDTYSSTTLASDTTPSAFTFTDVTNVALSATQTSNAITVAGLNTSTSVSISGGTYSKNGGAYTSANTTAVNGNTFAVRHTSSGSFSTATSCTLNIGGVTDVYTATTLAADTTPSAFTFTDVSTVALSTTQTSNAITVAGLNTSTSVSISGGTYSKNGGAYTSANTTAVNGNTFAVRHTSSASVSTAVNTTLNIGGVTDIYTSTTLGADTTPNSFTFTDVSNVPNNTEKNVGVQITGINVGTTVSRTAGTGTFAVVGISFTPSAGNFSTANKTITNNQYVHVKDTSGPYPGNTRSTTIDVGGVSDTWTITNVASDTTPDAFNFTDVTNSELNATNNSYIQLAGINYLATASISGSGATFAVNNSSTPSGTFNTTAKNMTNGQYCHVRRNASGSYGTTLATTITIGGVSDTWNVTTRASDSTPSSFSFTDVNNKLISSYHFDSVQITGIEVAVTAQQTAGVATFAVSGSATTPSLGNFTGTAKSITNNQYLHVRMQASGSFNTGIDTTFNVGGTTDTWTITTASPDTTPNSYSFSNLTNQAIGATITQSAQITGITASTSVTQNILAGGNAYTFAVGGSNPVGQTYNTTAKSITNGQYVHFRILTSSSYSHTHSANLSVGGVQANWQVQTIAADTSASNFTLTAVTNALRSSVHTASTAIAGIQGSDAPTTVTISGNSGTFAVNNSSSSSGATFGTTGSIYNGQYLHVRQTSSSSFNTGLSTTVVVGTGTYASETFTVTTKLDDQPAAFPIPATTGAALNTFATARTTNAISGLAQSVPVTVSGNATFAIGGSSEPNSSDFNQTSKSVTGGQYIWVKQAVGTVFNTTRSSTLTAGGTGGTVTSTFNTTTVAEDLVPAQFSFVDVTNSAVSTAHVETSTAITGINSTASATHSGTGGFFVSGTSTPPNTSSYTTSAQNITNGQYIHVRNTSSGSASTAVTTTITISGISDTFTITTAAGASGGGTTYLANVSANSDQGAIQIVGSGAGGSASSSALQLLAGDNITFTNTLASDRSITISGFSGFTSNSNVTLSGGQSVSKTWASGQTGGALDSITYAASSLSNVIRYYRQTYVVPDLVISDIADQTIASNVNSFTVTIAAGSSNTVYDIRTSGSTGTVVGTRTGNGTIPVSTVPSAGNLTNYYVTGRVTTSNGGSNVQSLINSFGVNKTGTSSTGGDGGTGTYGLKVLDASGNVLLDVSDRTVIFVSQVTGSLSSSETSKTISLPSAATVAINMTPETNVISNLVAQRQKILYTTILGTNLYIQRTSVRAQTGDSAEAVNYNFLCLFDPET